jgi:hypothetical protein
LISARWILLWLTDSLWMLDIPEIQAPPRTSNLNEQIHPSTRAEHRGQELRRDRKIHAYSVL